MRISVTADAHLRTRADYPERYNALENVFEHTTSEGIEHIIIAGDLFDKDFQNYSEFEGLCQQYKGLQFHIIPGNHDPNINEKKILGDNVHIYTEPTLIELGSAKFLFIPFEEKVTMGEKIAEMTSDIGDAKWVLIGHGDFYGGVKEINPLEPGTYMPLSRIHLEKYGPKIVLLGHIHTPLSQGRVHYTGSPCGLDISETGKRRFLVFNSESNELTAKTVDTDYLFYKESFVIIPTSEEGSILQAEIEKTIDQWDLEESDIPKVRLRIKAAGYASDRSKVLQVLEKGFERFEYYRDEGPNIDQLNSSSDVQLNAIAEKTISLIDDLEWSYGIDEPTKDQIKMAALSTIYLD